MFAGIQKAVWPGIAGFLAALASQILTGEGGPTPEQIAGIGVTIGEVVGDLAVGGLVALVAWTMKNINVNGLVMKFVARNGDVQDASGKIIGNIETSKVHS